MLSKAFKGLLKGLWRQLPQHLFEGLRLDGGAPQGPRPAAGGALRLSALGAERGAAQQRVDPHGAGASACRGKRKALGDVGKYIRVYIILYYFILY